MIINRLYNWFIYRTQSPAISRPISMTETYTRTYEEMEPITVDHPIIMNTPAEWVVQPQQWTIEPTVQTVDQTVDQTIDTEQVREWLQAFTNNAGFQPNQVIMHPTAWEHMRDVWDNTNRMYPSDIPYHRSTLHPVEDENRPNYR